MEGVAERSKERDWSWRGGGAGHRTNHREDVVESTISLPLHTAGTKWALTEAWEA